MSLSKMALLAAGLALALSSTALSPRAHAQTQNTPGNMLSDVGEDEAIIISPKGRVMKAKTKVSAAHHTKAMAMGGREIKGGMIYRKNGKLYLLEDKPGKAAGKTMMNEEFQDMFDTNTY